MEFEKSLQYKPYGLDRTEKQKLLTKRLKFLTEFHRTNCRGYGKILNFMGYNENKAGSYEDLPFLPVRLFKELSLKSVPDEEIIKTMTSSGTSGQKTSKIYLDRTTSSNQQKTMVKIVSDFTGLSRMPMIIVDCPSVIKNREMFSARGAGILGFSIFGTKKIYALNDDMKLDVQGIQTFLEQHQGERIFLFGFTFMIWQHFYKELVKLKEEGIAFDLSSAVMVHGGGWKKLISEAVSQEEFHDRLRAVCGIDNIHDYYGMVEQTGCIYMQCKCGHLHASIFSDVITRRARDFSICDFGEPGIIQVVSTIPESYPGHSLLTEDEGIILGEDDCPCGRKGKYFKVLGRIKNAEIRGCSDTYAADHSRLAVKGIDGKSDSDVVLDKIKYLVGSKQSIKYTVDAAPKGVFDNEIMEFCNALSKELMSGRDAKAFPDVVTLGFWLRQSSLKQMYNRLVCANADVMDAKIGRGVAFHIAPSNVPVNFAYSLFTGLLTGNANIVRVPSKDFSQVGIICDGINKVLENYEGVRPYITLVRYDRDKEINDYLSAICDTRVIWGGDATIADLRKSELLPRATEIVFADRYSLAVINSEQYLALDNKERIALDFYNDTYLSDQNACTSPRVVIWMGGEREAAKELFWGNLYSAADKRYTFQPIQGIDKLSMAYLAAGTDELENMKIINTKDNLLYRINVDKLSPNLMQYRGNSGYFYEFDCNDILDIREFCNDTHCQTIGYLGNKAEIEPLLMSGIKGVDRVVQIGHTMDFDLIWDGYNLVDRLTRVVAIR